MIPLDVVLDRSVACCGAPHDGRHFVLAPGSIFGQVEGCGWIAIPGGTLPYDRDDPWICFNISWARKMALKDELGY